MLKVYASKESIGNLKKKKKDYGKENMKYVMTCQNSKHVLRVVLKLFLEKQASWRVVGVLPVGLGWLCQPAFISSRNPFIWTITRIIRSLPYCSA